MSILTFPIQRSNKYDDNIHRYGEHSDTCVCCGKRTAEKLYIHMSVDFAAVDTTNEDLTEIDTVSQGMFPIGAECAKKFPKQFIFKNL